MKPIRSQAIRNSAKDEACTLNIIGVCNGNPATTVLAHLPDESHGVSRKSDEISAVFSCSSCHDCIDGRWQARWSEDDKCEFQNHREWYFRRALVRTWRRLIALGVVTVKR